MTNTLSFAPVKGDPDKHTFIVKNHEVVAYYDYSWARYGGMEYRCRIFGQRLHQPTRQAIEADIQRHYDKELADD